MSTESKLASREDSGKEVSEFSAEDLGKLFHYPSIGQLFSGSDSAAIGEFKARMISTRDQLEKIVRHGSREDADRAGIVIKSINVTLDFLSSLQEMRLGEK
jgi:hypothetical protein